jgi:FtsP/CotA-like multicopper oxidase with cupredoxin domain
VEIRVLNHLDEATSVHWHGIELESYFDGVSGWSGVEGSLSPAVAPGDSFMVRFTPPRAGTFIYHSHFSEDRQLAAGMYGALLVLPPGTRFDPATDHSWVVGHVDPAARIQPGVNGSRRPQLDLEAGRTHRIRIININPNLPFILELVGDSVPERWRAVAKDGADLPPRHASFGPARVRLGVGETADFEYTTPASSRTLRLRLVDPQGRSRLEGEVRVIPPG